MSDFSKRGLLATAILGCWWSGVAWSVPAAAGQAPFAAPWMDATHGPEPEMQVQRYDENTYVVRQSIKTNFEGPFIFLFFGDQRVLQIDSGAGGLKIRPTIDKVITDWSRAHGRGSIQLVVAHSHSHHDHVAGDEEFTGRPDTVVVGHSPEEVAAYFHVRSWPTEIATFDLGGGHVLDIIPSPGHEPAEISVYDRSSHLLLMGDALYPGRLYIPTRDFKIYQATIDRVADFTRSRPVAWILGNHIEMTQTPGRDYPMHFPSHPLEHRLELPSSRLLELRTAVDAMGDLPRLEVHDDFIIYPLP
jgi:glyoxylase-like metal-dependent hydrolase (beta-lactamase superfamily II)